MQIEKNNYTAWNSKIFCVEAIIDKTLWDEKLINSFQKNLIKILNEIYKKSYLIDSNKKFSVSVFFSGDKKISELNKRFRKVNLPTNVLSFPSFTGKNNETFLGDIIFSAETIKLEAKTENKTLNNHLTHLFIHGVLHLLGYDHETSDEATIMENFEINVLESLKINNPYK